MSYLLSLCIYVVISDGLGHQRALSADQGWELQSPCPKVHRNLAG